MRGKLLENYLSLQENPYGRAEVVNGVLGQDSPLIHHIGLQGDHIWSTAVSDIGLRIASNHSSGIVVVVVVNMSLLTTFRLHYNPKHLQPSSLR